MSEALSRERVLTILEAFERERRPLSLKELSEYCDIPLSTCHALVQTLLRRSYLYFAGKRKDLYPTRRVYDMGVTFLANDLVLQRVTPVMEALRDTSRETVLLGKRQRDQVLYLEVIESHQTIRYSARAGESKPLHSTCIGKTFLASMSSVELERWLAEHDLQPITHNTITAREVLLVALEKGRQAGYFITSGENVPDVTAVAVPLRMNNELYGLAVAGPSHRLENCCGDIAAALMHAALELEKNGVKS